jgi:hypothetical protein
MPGTLNEFDLCRHLCGLEIGWRNVAQWVRQKMSQPGLLAADSPCGVWEITAQGRKTLRVSQTLRV